ncbi:hypothetical protein Y032_0010g983 [Ancylostoma ceylanicum]|uniref:Uncharacterized protein n=1 Tax=Ancylostoma ceylanicum TaxID=53326 RepID=A0A016VJ75_9BILA|nr:hypothetical protein Y032_0010g983 [Ancylostoma ceylanicum]
MRTFGQIRTAGYSTHKAFARTHARKNSTNMKTLFAVLFCCFYLATAETTWCPSRSRKYSDYTGRQAYVAEVKIKLISSHESYDDYTVEYVRWVKHSSSSIFLDYYVPKIVVIPKSCHADLELERTYHFGRCNVFVESTASVFFNYRSGFNDLFHFEAIYGW